MGFHPKPWKFFEKNLVKLLVKCNFIAFSDCRQSYFIKRKGSGNEWVSRMESAVGIHFRRGKQQVSRLLSRWNLSVYSSVWTSRNPDFDLGVDFVDTIKMQFQCIFCKSICDIFKVFPLVGKMSRKWQMRGKQRKSFNQSFNKTD